MAYGPPAYGAPQQPTNWLKEAFHVLLAIVLVIVVLVLLTRFQWIHCSQVPGVNWCEIYCDNIIQKSSRVAVVYDPAAAGDSIGNATLLSNILSRRRGITLVQPYPVSQMSAGLLKSYDLVVLEQAPRLTFKQVDALLGYLDSGGTLVWVGDSASELYLSEEDLALALQRNATEPGSYEEIVKMVNNSYGFGYFGDRALLARFVGEVNVTEAVTLSLVDTDHPITGGIFWEFETLPMKQFAYVSENPAGVDKIAVLKYKNKEYPAILETRYAGKVVYFAYPIEATNSTSLMDNLLDYLLPC
ncbi:MAG: hypothetical protein V1834_04965 [Candidatus Micrarchaeota archaeon]